MRIASVGTALPPHRYSQTEVTEALCRRWEHKLPEPRLLPRLHANCGVDFRHFVLPLEAYPALAGFRATNDQWIAAALDLSQTAIDRALTPLGLTAADISAIFFASVTGIASPTIDARLINRMPFPASVKRTPIFGLGCVAGAAGIARASDYVRAFPGQIALLLSVELCSLTWQDDDQSIANLISCGLFGDGAAAVVIAGDNVALPASSPPPRPPHHPPPRPRHPRHPLHLLSQHRVRHGLGDRRHRLHHRPLARRPQGRHRQPARRRR
jgi:alkylresorcinol/alkylpyrone synthase